MKLFATTSTGTKELTIADSWDKVTTDQFQQIVPLVSEKEALTTDDKLKLFSILSGLPVKAIAQSADKELEQNLFEAIAFLAEWYDFKSLEVPREIKIGDKVIQVPKYVGHLTIGQNIHVREQMENVKVYEELISFVIAIYLQPLYDETDFDYFRATQLHEKVLKMPIVDTYALGFFLLSPLMPSGGNILNRWSLTLARLWRGYTLKGRL